VNGTGSINMVNILWHILKLFGSAIYMQVLDRAVNSLPTPAVTNLG
jgi:hypothetical protein